MLYNSNMYMHCLSSVLQQNMAHKQFFSQLYLPTSGILCYIQSSIAGVLGDQMQPLLY